MSTNQTNLIKASILVPLVERNRIWNLVITKRSKHIPAPGLWVFPGGRQEQSDIDESWTAIRETQEEIGIPFDSFHILTRLRPRQFKQYDLTPVVGIITTPEILYNLQAREVAAIAEIPANKIFQNASCRSLANEFSYKNVRVYGLHFEIIQELKESDVIQDFYKSKVSYSDYPVLSLTS